MSLNKRLGWETPRLQNKDKVKKSCSKLTSSHAFISFALSMYLYTFFPYTSFFCLTLSKYVVAIMTFCPDTLPYPLHNHNIPLIHTIILYTVYIQMLPTVPGIPLIAFLFPICSPAQDEVCIRLSCLFPLLQSETFSPAILCAFHDLDISAKSRAIIV